MVQNMQGAGIPQNIEQLRQNVVSNERAQTKSSEMKESFFKQNSLDNQSICDFKNTQSDSATEASSLESQVNFNNTQAQNHDNLIGQHLSNIKDFNNQISELEAQLQGASSESTPAEGEGVEGAAENKVDIESIKQKIEELKQNIKDEQAQVENEQKNKEMSLRDATTAKTALERVNSKLTSLEKVEIPKAEQKAVDSAKSLDSATQTNETDGQNLKTSQTELTKAEKAFQEMKENADFEKADVLLNNMNKIQEEYKNDAEHIWCAQAVRKGLQSEDVKLIPDGIPASHAKDYKEILDNNENFGKIDTEGWTKEDYDNFFKTSGKGCVVVYGEGATNKSGHLTVVGENGEDNSDTKRDITKRSDTPIGVYYIKKQNVESDGTGNVDSKKDISTGDTDGIGTDEVKTKSEPGKDNMRLKTELYKGRDARWRLSSGSSQGVCVGGFNDDLMNALNRRHTVGDMQHGASVFGPTKKDFASLDSDKKGFITADDVKARNEVIKNELKDIESKCKNTKPESLKRYNDLKAELKGNESWMSNELSNGNFHYNDLFNDIDARVKDTRRQNVLQATDYYR